MNTLSLMNLVTSTIATKLQELDYQRVKWPNTKLDTDHVDDFIEISITPYLSQQISYTAHQHFGVVTCAVYSKRDIGAAWSVDHGQKIMSCLSNQVIQGVTFKAIDVKILNSTLSSTQTTTSIPWFQINANVEYDFIC